MSETFSRVSLGGWSYFENTFRVVQPDGREVVVVVDRETTELLGNEFTRRAKRMFDREA